MDIKQLFKAGRLEEAIGAAQEEVKLRPAEAAKRWVLAEMFCFAGKLEQADRQLDAVVDRDPQVAAMIMVFRQLIRAEQARQQFHEEGRMPDLLGGAPEHVQRHLKASIHLRRQEMAEAAEILAEAEQARPAPRGTVNGEPFDDLRDIADLTAPVFEVFTANGKYYWIPIERVIRLEFRPPEHPRDLLWRSAHLAVRGGPSGEVHLPSLYCGSHAEEDPRIRLGRMTDWRDLGSGVIAGIGQRIFLAGEREWPIMELTTVAVEENAPEPDEQQDHGQGSS